MMQKEQIENIMKDIGLPYSYDHFSTHDWIEPPFVVWRIPGSDNFNADGTAYVKIDELDIELYSDQKDWENEEKIEKVLEQYGIPYRKTGDYLETEKMYETLYETEA